MHQYQHALNIVSVFNLISLFIVNNVYKVADDFR